MVHIPTLLQMNKFYEDHRSEILSHPERFAVITPGLKLSYYSNREDLYRACPEFQPDQPERFGTSPLLIDIGRETNSPEYLGEVLTEKRDRANQNLSNAMKELAEANEGLEKL